MKILLLSALLLTMSLLGFAQVKESGDLQIGVFGGASFPVGTYKTVGNTKTGYFTGVFADKYFSGNKFGIGVDARYLTHQINQADSLNFQNGYLATTYFNAAKFKHWAFTLGPTYKYSKGKFHLEAFVRGGILMQHFPKYETTLNYRGTQGMVTVPIQRTLNDSTNKANSWVGLGGLRFNYAIAKNWSVFVQADYMQSFGSKFGGKASMFQIEERLGVGSVLESTSAIKDYTEFYEDQMTPARAPYKSVNVGVGIKYVFGKKSTERSIIQPVTSESVSVAPVQKEVSKDIQIVVKDKQTGIALSGVTVTIESANYNSKDISNANGEIARIKNATIGSYQVMGEKNGIKTELITISVADFASNEAVIFREIFHDDPRFTLIGETVDCELDKQLAHIATVLTNTADKNNMTQTSDKEGKFIYQLNQHADYTIVANQAGRYSQTEMVTTKNLDRSKTLYVTLKLGVCELIEGGNWVLKNIHYDFDKSNIRTDAAIILDNVVAIMKQNPTLQIELSSHTDSRGRDDYNKRLSQQRAEAAVAYLVKNGIQKDRLVAKGYGETRLLNDCGNNADCSEEAHQENRRTEIKILKLN